MIVKMSIESTDFKGRTLQHSIELTVDCDDLYPEFKQKIEKLSDEFILRNKEEHKEGAINDE